MFRLDVGLIGFIGLVLVVYALFHVIGSSTTTLSKTLWTVILLVFPFIGFVAWLILGPRSQR